MKHNNIKYISIIIVLFSLFSYFYIDKFLADYFSKIIIGDSYKIWSFITEFGSAEYVIIISIILIVVFYKFNRYIYNIGLFILSSIILSGIITDILKFLIGRSRPIMYLDNNGIYTFKPASQYDYSFISFPSGHTSTAFSVGIALMLLFPKLRYFFIVLASAIALSRVTLQKHFLSDIMVGALIGSISAIYLYNRYFKSRVNIGG